MNRRTKYVSLQKPQSEIILHIMAYPRNKFKKFHIDSYNAEDTNVNAVRDSISVARFLPLKS